MDIRLSDIASRFCQDESGASMVEYGVALFVVIAVGTAAMTFWVELSPLNSALPVPQLAFHVEFQYITTCYAGTLTIGGEISSVVFGAAICNRHLSWEI